MRRPSRWMWMRSATSNTCGMLWLISTIGRPRALHVQDQLEHLARFLHAQRRGRLVHDHDVAAERGRARHRDALALAARERLDRLADVLDGEQAERVQLVARLALHPGAVEHAEPAAEEARLPPLAAEKHVVGDRQAPATGRGSGRRSRCRPRAPPCGDAEMDHVAVQPDLALVGTTAPDRALISVDLPAPLSPITARISPGRRSKSA